MASVARVHRGRRRRARLDGHPGRLLPAPEGDAGRRRARGAGRPGQHPEEHRDDPRGAPGRRHRRRPRGRRPTSPAQYEKVLANPEAIGLPELRRTATPRATCSRRPTTSAPRTTPKSILREMVDRWQQAADDADLEAARRGARLHAGRADDRRQPGRGRGARATRTAARSPGSSTTGSRATRPTGCSRSTPSVNYGLDQKLGVALTTEELQQRHAVQHLHATRGSRRRRSRRPATRRSRRRPTRPRVTGTTT